MSHWVIKPWLEAFYQKSCVLGHVNSATSQSWRSSIRVERRSWLSEARQVRIWTKVSSVAEQTGQRGESRCWRRCISTPEGVSPLIHFVINFRWAKEACFLALVILVQQTRSLFRRVSSISHLLARYSMRVFRCMVSQRECCSRDETSCHPTVTVPYPRLVNCRSRYDCPRWRSAIHFASESIWTLRYSRNVRGPIRSSLCP